MPADRQPPLAAIVAIQDSADCARVATWHHCIPSASRPHLVLAARTPAPCTIDGATVVAELPGESPARCIGRLLGAVPGTRAFLCDSAALPAAEAVVALHALTLFAREPTASVCLHLPYHGRPSLGSGHAAAPDAAWLGRLVSANAIRWPHLSAPLTVLRAIALDEQLDWANCWFQLKLGSLYAGPVLAAELGVSPVSAGCEDALLTSCGGALAFAVNAAVKALVPARRAEFLSHCSLDFLGARLAESACFAPEPSPFTTLLGMRSAWRRHEAAAPADAPASRDFLARILRLRRTWIIDTVARAPGRNVFVYGSGGHSLALLPAWRALDLPPIAGFLTSGGACEPMFMGLPVATVDAVDPSKLALIVVSSQSYEGAMLRTCNERFPTIPTLGFYDRSIQVQMLDDLLQR